MKPYYQSQSVTVYKCQFQKVVEQIANNQPYETIVISDPPYNIGFNGYDEYSDTMPDDEYIEMLCELQKFGRVVLCDYPIQTMKYIVPALGVPDAVASWNYNANIPNRFRLISFYGCKPDYSRVKQPYKNPSDKRVAKLIANGSEGTNLYEWWTDIQLVKNVSKEKTSHPCPVPEALQQRIIKLVCNEGDIIFDPFAGSLTTLKAAKDLGYKSIGCELSETYIREGLARLGVHGFSTPSNTACTPTAFGVGTQAANPLQGNFLADDLSATHGGG